MTTVATWLNEVSDLPRTDCEILLTDLAGISRASILANPQQGLAADCLQRLRDAAILLRDDVPLAYVVGHQGFWTLDFKVTTDVLIPRPDTELLVELVLELARPSARVLDLGTGSGAIAISLAATRTDLQVTATDRSAAALAVARENASNLQQQNLVDFIASDWFTSLQGQWDVIVSNPPYIAQDDEHLPGLAAEPQQALVSPDNGLADLQHIVQSAASYLSPRGLLILEHGYNQSAEVRQMMTQAGFTQVRSAKDLAHIERATLGFLQNG